MVFIIVPVYNEEQNIATVISELRKCLKSIPYKIIAVNDGSKDASLKILKDNYDSDIIIETYKVNMNVGAAFSTGLFRAIHEAKSDEDIAIIMEGDQTSSTDVINNLINEIQKKQLDIVIASRYRNEGGFKNFPLLRRLYSKNASRLMRKFFPRKNDIQDYSIFFRAYKIGVLRKAVEHFGYFGLIQSKGFVANAELLVKLSMLTDKIGEIPFIYDYGKKKGQSKIHVFRTIIEYFVVISYLRSINKKVALLKK